jgi:DNA-binding FrmR family transcriptional regulator
VADWTERKGRVLGRLKRAEGQVRAISGMVEREDDCEHIAQQLAAVRKALDRAFYDMMACATQRELEASGAADAKVMQRLDHLNSLLARYG